MRRSYRSKKFLGILEKVRERIPHAAITTDIIVGFPGETEEDFQATLDVVEQARFSSAFTFQYSKRPGTPAAELPDQLPKAVVQERYERLTALQDRICAEENAKQVGREVEVLVTAQSGRKAEETHRLSGRSADQRLVHFSVPDGRRHSPPRRPGHRHGHRRRAVPPGRRPGRRLRLPAAPLPRRRRLGPVRRPSPAACRPPDAARARACPWACRPLPPRPPSAGHAAGHRRRRTHRHGQVGPGHRTGPAAGRGSRQRRCPAVLPRHGHRHGQDDRRRAPRRPAPPAGHPGRHAGGQRRRRSRSRPGRSSPTSARGDASPSWPAAPGSTSGPPWM